VTEAPSKAKRIFIRGDGGTVRPARTPARIIIRRDGGTVRSAGIPARIPIGCRRAPAKHIRSRPATLPGRALLSKGRW
jgi:hypothetical protein